MLISLVFLLSQSALAPFTASTEPVIKLTAPEANPPAMKANRYRALQDGKITDEDGTVVSVAATCLLPKTQKPGEITVANPDSGNGAPDLPLGAMMAPENCDSGQYSAQFAKPVAASTSFTAPTP